MIMVVVMAQIVANLKAMMLKQFTCRMHANFNCCRLYYHTLCSGMNCSTFSHNRCVSCNVESTLNVENYAMLHITKIMVKHCLITNM